MFITRETRCQRAAEQREGKRAGAAGQRRGSQSGAFGLGRTSTGSRREPQGAGGSRREPQGAEGSRREAGDPPGAEHTGLKRLKEHEITKYKFNTSDELESFPSGKH